MEIDWSTELELRLRIVSSYQIGTVTSLNGERKETLLVSLITLTRLDALIVKSQAHR